MESVANFFAVIFMIALIIVVAPQLFELLAFLFVIFLQVMVGYMVASFIFSVMRNTFGNEEEGQKAWTF